MADTVFEYNAETEAGNGFLFKDCIPGELLYAIKRAITAYSCREKWLRLIQKIAGYDFSWNRSAEEYIKIYEKISGK